MNVNTWLFQHALPKLIRPDGNWKYDLASSPRPLVKPLDVRKKRLPDKNEMSVPPPKQPRTSSTKHTSVGSTTITSKVDSSESQDGDDKKNRGNYRCSRCNLPKRGHICPFQTVYRKREGDEEPHEFGSSMVDAENQTEFDPTMTVRALGDLDRQGLPESYENSIKKEPTHIITGAHAYHNDCSKTASIVDHVASASVNEVFSSAECIVEEDATINDCALSSSTSLHLW